MLRSQVRTQPTQGAVHQQCQWPADVLPHEGGDSPRLTVSAQPYRGPHQLGALYMSLGIQLEDVAAGRSLAASAALRWGAQQRTETGAGNPSCGI